MLRTLARWFPATVGVLLLIGPLLAHHAISAKFDASKKRTLTGVVTMVDWANPHVHVLVNVQEGARLVSWAVELESELELERSAWRRDWLKAGDAVTVEATVAAEESLAGFDMLDREMKALFELVGHHLGLAGAQEPVIDEDAREPRAQGFGRQHRRHR